MEQHNMMGNGMPAQNNMMNSMQRPQQGNGMQQIHARIMDNMRSRMGSVPPGWQTTFDIGQRASRTMQLASGLRLLDPEPGKCVQIAESFEERTLLESPNKEIYLEKMQRKMAEVTKKRQQNAQTMNLNQMAMNNMAQNGMGGMGNMNNMQNGGMSGINMNNMGMGMGMGGMNMGAGNNGMGMGMPQMGNGGQQNQNFPAQLQRQMQPSPLPQQQQPNTLNPAALQNSQMSQQQMGQQMPNMDQNMQQQTPRPQQPNMNMNGQGQGQGQMQGGGNSNFEKEVMGQAQTLYNHLPDERKAQIRNNYLANMNDQQRELAQKDGDPVFKICVNKAKDQILKSRQQRLSQGAMQNGNGMQMGNMGMNQNNAQQTPGSQGGQQNIDFAGIMGQQANAIKSAESGEQVVPASSNPNMDFGGASQTNMSQGVNPQQLMGNQNNNNQGNVNPQQMQYMMQQRMQQEQQHRQLLAQKQAMAQQQQNQLRGQPGGLNAPNALNGGQVNSPAMNMNMLNRPMAPPGQTTPSTPQPNRNQGMPQTPTNTNNPANQLAQHHQSMVNQKNAQMNQGGQGPMQALSQNMPPQIRDKLATLPPEHQQAIFMKIRENPQAYQAGLMNMLNGLQPQRNEGQMGNQQQQPQQQQQMMQGMPPNMSNAVPTFNSQPPPNQNQDHGQQGANNQATQQQRMQAHQFAAMKARAMDFSNFPPPTPQNLGIQVPSTVKTWADLKTHIQRNQSVLPPNLLDKLGALQQQWFSAHPEQLKQAIQNLQQHMRSLSQQGQGGKEQQQPQQQQQPTPQSGRPPSAAPGGPNGQAPPAQMAAPSQGMQPPPPNQTGGMPNLSQMPTPSAEDIMKIRQQNHNFQNLTDDQIKAMLMKRKQQQFAQMQVQQRNAQMQRAQAAANAQQGSAAPQQPTPQQQQQPPRPAQHQQQTPNQQAQGQKRQQRSSDDVMEIPNPNQQSQMNAPQPPGMQPGQQLPPNMQIPGRMPTQEELERMDPQMRSKILQRIKQMEHLKRAQPGAMNNQGAAPVQPQPPQQGQQRQAGHPPQQAAPQPPAGIGVPNAQIESKIKALWEETQRSTQKGPPKQLDSQGLEQVQSSLKRLWPAIMNLDRTFIPALRAPQFGEERVKQAMRAKIIVQQNARDEKGNTKDYLSVSPTDLKKLEVFVGSYFTGLKELKAKQDASRVQAQAQAQGAAPTAAQSQAQQPPQQPAQQAAPPTKPAAPERKQSHTRKASAAANKAPPAPTENKTFDWGAQSPHGVPKYDSARNELTADKLKIPPQKKRKTQAGESQEDTPAAQTSTPQATSSSPAAKAQAAQAAAEQAKNTQQAKVEALPKFKCEDPNCEASVRGFETEVELLRHRESAHKPIEDPFKFLDETLETAQKNLKAEKPVPAPVKATVQVRGKPVAEAKSAAVKKEGQTPDIKSEGTPAARPVSVKGGAKSTPAPAGKKDKAPDSAVEVPEKEKTLLESMAAKIGFELPTNTTTEAAPAEPSTAPDFSFEDLFSSSFDNNALGDEWFAFSSADIDSITDWGLPRDTHDSSPDLTPSSGASQSSRESDISASDRLVMNLGWDAFGNGDTGVPDVLMQTLGLDNDLDFAMGDVSMGDGEEVKNDGEADKKNTVGSFDDWSKDLMDWDSVFGPQAGLGEGEGLEFGMVL